MFWACTLSQNNFKQHLYFPLRHVLRSCMNNDMFTQSVILCIIPQVSLRNLSIKIEKMKNKDNHKNLTGK